jgi:hypothetical protein
MPALQELIHKLDLGPWLRYIRIGSICMGIVLLLVGYNWRSFRNMATQEAMDAAQVARNLAEGKGYTTLFIRPLSMHLVKKRNEAKLGVVPSDSHADYTQIKGMHPDLANAPVYPCVLAGLMKVLPFKYEVNNTAPFWSRDGHFWRSEPDFLISLFNELLFFAVIVMTFFLARRLFDANVAWLSAVLLLGCELFWRFSVSGLSTMLLLLIFTGLVWCLVFLEREAREPKWGQTSLLLLSVAAGLLTGVGTLTRYSFGWLIIPVLVFLILLPGPRKAVLCSVVLVVFAIMVAPWVYRNYIISGTPFGTASFAALETTFLFPGNRLERSLEPDFSSVFLTAFIYKLLINSRQILQSDLPRLGGNWTTSFFLVGLLLPFRNLAVRRLRYFLGVCFGILVVVQALGRTQLSDDSPDINSENLLILLAPLVLVYGVSLFFALLDQMKLLFLEARYLAIGLFAVVMCLPMICAFLPPRTVPLVYPPYYPPVIQQISNWMKENELMMSDIPWAVAWYGNRQCLWLTLNAAPDPKDPNSRENFFTVFDYQKPIRAVYLTPQTMDSRFLTEWIRAGEHSWGNFIIESVFRHQFPPNFPLRIAPGGFLPEQLFLTDWERWKITPIVKTTPGK